LLKRGCFRQSEANQEPDDAIGNCTAAVTVCWSALAQLCRTGAISFEHEGIVCAGLHIPHASRRTAPAATAAARTHTATSGFSPSGVAAQLRTSRQFAAQSMSQVITQLADVRAWVMAAYWQNSRNCTAQSMSQVNTQLANADAQPSPKDCGLHIFTAVWSHYAQSQHTPAAAAAACLLAVCR
jgi:hypothetical protein